MPATRRICRIRRGFRVGWGRCRWGWGRWAGRWPSPWGRLEDLGVSPECARAWMTLVMGTRRGTRAPLLEAGADELARRAEAVVAALNTSPEW